MFHEIDKEMQAQADEIDDGLRTSASSFEPIGRTSSINTYAEIGKSLQNLRKTVYDMARKDAEQEVHFPAHGIFRRSPPTGTFHHSEHSSHMHTSHSTGYDSSRRGEHYRSPAAHSSEHDPYTPPTDSHYEFQLQQQTRHSRGRVSTPYRHEPRKYDQYDHIQPITAQDLHDSEGVGGPDRPPSGLSKSGSSDHKKKRSSRRRRARTEELFGAPGTGTEAPGGVITTPPASSAPSPASHASSTGGSSAESSPASEAGAGATTSAAVEVSQSIAVIVGQHEERFISLSKEIDFWRERSNSLASQLAETGKSYDSKLEHVLVAQESLSEQQQQVLRELSAALAAQQALAAAATAVVHGSHTDEDGVHRDGSPNSASATDGATRALPALPLTPEQVRESDLLLRQSLEKLDQLIRLTTDLKSTTATPMKGPGGSSQTASGVPVGAPDGSGALTGPAMNTPLPGAMRHTSGSTDASATTAGAVPMLPVPGSGLLGPTGASPRAFELHPDASGVFSPADLRLITFQTMAHRQEDMVHMQRLYDTLTQQLRRLFEEKAQLVEELTECKSTIGELQTQLRVEAEASQSAIDEMKTEFESQLRAARLLTQEAKDQVANLKASERRYQDTERELNMRIADLDTQLNSRVVEVTNTRTSLLKANQRVTSLQDELAEVTSKFEDHDVQVQELRRKHKELSRTSLAKDEAIGNLQKELAELQQKLKKPFTTSVKAIENTEKRINYEYEVSLLKDSVLAIQESEAELQKEYLHLQAESKQEIKRIKDASATELAQINAEHEAVADRLRKELHARKRQLEQQTRLRSIAEDELAELRVQFVKHEEALMQCKLENSELQHGNELVRNQVEELKDQLSGKQEEISKILAQLQRAKKRVDKLELALDEKEKMLTEVNLRQQRLQQSIRSHAEREIDHLNALKHTMQTAAHRLSAAEQVSTLLLKNAGSPGSAQSSPGLSMLGSGGRDGLPASVRGRKLSLPALEAECDALWEDIPNAVEAVMNELKQYHLRNVTLSADLQAARLNCSSVSTEMSAHVSKQQQEILSLQQEIETREINARKRLDKYKTASQAEFTAQIERLKGELQQMSQQIDAVAADRAQQVSHLKAERAALQEELAASKQRVQDLARHNGQLQDAAAVAEKRLRVAVQEVMAELNGFPALPSDHSASSGKLRLSPTNTASVGPFSAAASTAASASAAAEEAQPGMDSNLAPEHLLGTATVLLRSKAKEVSKFLKSRRRLDTQQLDAMKTFLESINSSFVSVTQSHRAHLLHDQIYLLNGADSPVKATHTVARTDHAHLYPYLCGEDGEMEAMLRTLEESIFDTLQRSMNVETHLIHKKKEMDELRTELSAAKREVALEQDAKANLTTKIHRLEAHLHEQISVVGRTNEEMSERESQLINDREVLEADLTEMEEKYQVASQQYQMALQRSDQLETVVSNLEEEQAGLQQELRDARHTLDEVFGQLQASQGRLGDMQQELRGTQNERDALQQRLQEEQQKLEAELQRWKDSLEQEQRDHDSELQRLQDTLQQRLQDLQRDHTAEAQRLKDTLQQRLQEEQRDHESELQRLKDSLQMEQRDHAEEVQRLAETHQQRLQDTQRDHEAALLRMREELELAQRTIAEHESTHTEVTTHVLQLRETISETNGTQFQLETTIAKLRLKLAEAEGHSTSLDAELQETKEKLADTERQLEAKLEQIVASERQIAELCGEVESRSQSLSQETMTLRQAKEQLAFSSTALAHLQINHSALQKDHDQAKQELVEQTERVTILEGQVDEQTATIADLQAQVSKLMQIKTYHESSHIELSGRSEELAQQLRVYQDLESDFNELQLELSGKVDELEQARSEHADEVQQYETALAEAADRQRQLEEEQEILSEKLISLANAAAEWPARQEALEAEVAVGQGQVKALAAQVTEYEERLQRFAKQDQVVAALDTELTDLKHQVRRLNGELQASHAQNAETRQELATAQSTCAQLEELCDNLSTELQEHKQALSELRETVRERETALSVAAKQEGSLQSLTQALEAERTTLREKLDAASMACTEAQIDLAEKTATLKMQLQLKEELLSERDELRRQLEGAVADAHRVTVQTERYREKLEEVTKELNFVQSRVDRKEETFASQRTTIRELREENDKLETSLLETRERCVALQVKLDHRREVEDELEDCRKQLLIAAQEREQLKHANQSLADLRRQLEHAHRDLTVHSDSQRSHHANYTELQQVMIERESTNRELTLRVQQAEAYQAKCEAVTTQLHSTSTELATARAELRTTTEALHSAKASLDAANGQLVALREETALVKHQGELAKSELVQRAAAIDALTRTKTELEYRVTHLEATNRDLQVKVVSAESSKSEYFDRALESVTKEKDRLEARTEQLQSQLDAATRDGAATRRTLDETQARLTVSDGQVQSLRSELQSLQQDHAAVKLELSINLRERKHLEEQSLALAAHKAEAENYKSQCAELQRQLQQATAERYAVEQKEAATRTQEVFTLRRELDEARLQLGETKKYKEQCEAHERERVTVLRDLAELKVENERLQSRIKTTQMDMELSQRQYQFSNLMLAGNVGRSNPYDSPVRSDRLSSAMENISSLLKEKEAAVVQGVTAQQTLEQTTAQLAEARHQNTSLAEANAKLEAKLEKLRERLESTVAQRSADEQKALSLRDEISALNTQVQIKAHDLQIKTQECDKLATAKDGLERRLADEMRSMQDKWLKAQGDLQKETHMCQTLQFQIEEAKRDKAALEERFRNELLFVQKTLEAAKSEAVAAQDQLLQVKGQGVNDKERVAILSSKVSELTARLDQAEANCERSKEEVNKASAANAALSAKLATAAQQCRDWEHQLEQQHSKYDALQARFDQQTTKCDGLQSKLDALTREVTQALAVVERNAGQRTMLSSRADSSVSVDYLVEHLTTEITKYQTVYTEVTERRSDNAALESRVLALQKAESVQKTQIQELSNELSTATKQLGLAQTQVSTLQEALHESEDTLASVRALNTELEFMCDSMTTELKQAMRRVEELDTGHVAQREEWARKLETARAEAEARVQREVVPLQKQVATLTEKLEKATDAQQELSQEQLQYKTEVVRLSGDLESITDSARALYQQVVAAGPMGSPAKSLVPDLHKSASPTALLNSLQSTFNEWGRQLADLRVNASTQAEAVQLKNRLIDELQVRLQQTTNETIQCFQALQSELDKFSRAVASKTPPSSPRSNPSSPTGRKISFTSPQAGTPGSVVSTADETLPSTLYNRALRTLSTLQSQVDRSIQAHMYECDRLRVKLAQKERDYESVASIQDSARQLQRTQQEQQLQTANELFQAKQAQQALHAEHVQALQRYRESLQAEHAEQMHLLKETHKAQLTKQAQQLKQSQQALSRALRERTALQEALDALRTDYAAREQEIRHLNDHSAASQQYFEATQDRYVREIAELEGKVESLTAKCKDLQQQVARAAAVSTAMATATTTGSSTASIYGHGSSVDARTGTDGGSASRGDRSDLFRFDGTVLTKEEIQVKLQELIEYRNSTEQKILDFDNLIMSTFYHRSAASSPDVAAGAGGGAGSAGQAGSGVTSRHILKSPEQLRFELEHDDEEEDRDRGFTDAKGGHKHAAFAPTSPTFRAPSDARQDVLRQRLHSSGSASLSPPGSMVHTASGSLLSGMLQDFHHVLKEHRRLKRLCSSQQVCIMALRLLMKETESAEADTEEV